ncbi:MAG: DUF5717 family protein [Lachnospiraceae bacterium]|jgi:hypothetical protein|nr:DUF5717 family protein [Lachnospiraceae bacterium]
MQDVINHILDGTYGYEAGTLDFSCATLELNVIGGDSYEGSFFISSPPGQLTTGYCLSTDTRMELLTKKFSGTREEIRYCFHAEHLEEGETPEGNIYVVSNLGEYSLPFVVKVERVLLSSSIGNIKNLFHFANLAKSNWKEALALFYSPAFATLFFGNDTQYFDLYRGLCTGERSDQNMDEFLINIHKKGKVEFLLEQTTYEIDNPSAVAEVVIPIGKNGWGYTHLAVEVDGEFAFVQKSNLTEDDFLGHYCRLPIYIDSTLLSYGKNIAKVRLTNPRMQLFGKALCVTIIVQKDLPGKGSLRYTTAGKREEKKILLTLMESYLNMRLKKMNTATWIKEASQYVDRLRSLDDTDVAAKLFAAQLLITQERYHEAKWMLEHSEKQLMTQQSDDNGALEAYYLYLTTLIDSDEEYDEKVAAQVERIYRKDPTCYHVAWLLLYLSKDLYHSQAQKWEFLGRQIAMGCTSPIIYCEALLMMNANPTILRKLEDFELQVLLFGAKRGAINAELQEQILYLSGRVKEYNPKLYLLLRICYEISKDVRQLKEICGLLIKGGKTDTCYFVWFRLGVENELRITKLYDYYMATIPTACARTQVPGTLTAIPRRTLQPSLPKSVLLYYSYQTQLDVEHSAFLYLVVLGQRKDNPELFASYQERIERFVEEQIKKDYSSTYHALPYLIALYEEFLTPKMLDQDAAHVISKLCFLQELYIPAEKIKKVVIAQPGNLKVAEYPVEHHIATLPLYDPESTILFEDEEGNRYGGTSISYSRTDLSLTTRFLAYVQPVAQTNKAFGLYLYHTTPDPLSWQSDLAKEFVTLSADATIASAIRGELMCKVMSYYYEHDDIKSLNLYLDTVDPMLLNTQERAEAQKYMLLCEKLDLANEWIAFFGPDFANAKVLLRLCSRQIQLTDFAKDKRLTQMAIIVFRSGKYDANILQYLSYYYTGPLREMHTIWTAAHSFEIDCYKIAERILLQTLFTHANAQAMIEVFRYYVSQGARSQVEEAFLALCSYDYYAKEKETNSYIFREILHMFHRNEMVNKVCKLAFLKYISTLFDDSKVQLRQLTQDHPAYNAVSVFLRDMMQEGIHLPFFKKLRGFESILLPMMDKSIVEYHAKGDHSLRIHFMRKHESGEAGEYQKMEMKRVLGRVFTFEFVLFFGEKLEYYITESTDTKQLLQASGELQRTDDLGNVWQSRYEQINNMVINKTLGDYEALEIQYKEFLWKEFAGNGLFIMG